MSSLSQLWLFLLGSFIIVVIPGPNILYLVARSIHQGRIAGILSVLGIETATLVHICAATLSLSSLLMSSALAFNTVKYFGAAYLVYLGIRKLIAREEERKEELHAEGDLPRVFYQGFIVNLLNPKASMFFLAFLPQFVNVGSGNVGGQILCLGLVLILLATTIELAYVLLSVRLRTWLQGNGKFQSRQRYLAGGAYVGLGLSTAISGGR